MGDGTAQAENLVGLTLEGGYRIDSFLGEGGMGAVYRATHLRLNRRVAVKVLASALAANAESLARFHREALVTGGLGHPHIVQVFDFSTTLAGQPFLVMELLEGEDLEHRLCRVGRLPPAEVVPIVKQVASALAATHAQAIVHRDLKPGNVFLLQVAGEANFVKVLDFGISKMRAATHKLTRTASIMGTPNYMSPEQARGRIDEIDERTDQWALACIAWECLAGERPFVGEEGTSILYQVVHEPPPPLLPKVPGLAPQVEAVLLRAMAKAKNSRFPTVNDFALAFENAVTGIPREAPQIARTVRLPDAASTAPASPSRTTFTQSAGQLDQERTYPSSSSKRWIWGLSVVPAIVSLSVAVLLFHPRAAPIHATSPAVVSLPPPAASPPPAAPPPAPPASDEPPPAPALAKLPAQEAAEAPPPAKADEPQPAKRETKPADTARTQGKKRSGKKSDKENQDEWRLD